MAQGLQQTVRLKRRLHKWQIFFIALGGVIGVGFVQGASKTLGVAGPLGALMATIVVGLVAVAVMEAICHLICIWPIPNAMVEFVKAFVDDDLGTAIGVLYWYTYCITFSVLISAIGRFADYWGENYLRKTTIYIAVPLVLLGINAAPVQVYGWVELFGGIIKLALVIAIFMLMLLLNLGVATEARIGAKFIEDSIQFNPNVASSKFAAVSACFPTAIFAYIGVELLTTTAFEARDPREMRLPARNVGWFTLLIYGLTTGVFVSNVNWTDQNLPKLFNQALATATTKNGITWKVPEINEEAHVAPILCLLHLGFDFLPGFINGCLIYSAFSCANTALYVASRQLYGLTRTITVDSESGHLRSFAGWLGRVEHRTQSPWPALFVSVLTLYWLPFLRRANNYEAMDDVQTVLSTAGSVGCILVWCSQCVAYSFFYKWRAKHLKEVSTRAKYDPVLDTDNTGWIYVCQPYLSYLAVFATLAIVFFFNTATLWNGKREIVKAISAFASPTVLLVTYIIKKFTRKRYSWRFWNDLSKWKDFESKLQHLTDLVFPEDADAQSDFEVDISGSPLHVVNPPNQGGVEGHSLSDVSTAADTGVNAGIPCGDLTFTPHQPNQLQHLRLGLDTNSQPRTVSPDVRGGAVSPLRPEELMAAPAGTASAPHSPSELTGSPTGTSRFYNGRSSLWPRDAVAYPQHIALANVVRPELEGTEPQAHPQLQSQPARQSDNNSNINPYPNPYGAPNTATSPTSPQQQQQQRWPPSNNSPSSHPYCPPPPPPLLLQPSELSAATYPIYTSAGPAPAIPAYTSISAQQRARQIPNRRPVPVRDSEVSEVSTVGEQGWRN